MIQCVHRIVDYKCYILENWLCLYVDYPSNDESAAHHRRDVYTRNRHLSLRSTCWFKRCWPYLRQNAFDRTYLLSLALSFWNTIVCAPPRCIHPVFASLSRDKVPNLCEFDLCILATLSIFFLFPKWKTIIVLSCPWFSDRETHRARNGWSKDLQLNRSYHRKSIKNRQFAPV